MASYPTTALQPGSTNTTAVKQLQDFLVSQGFMTRSQVNTGYGTYGPQTTAAVLAYQKANGVDYSSGPGYWGPKTISVASKSTTPTVTPTPTAPKPPVPPTPVPTPPSTNYRPLDPAILSQITSRSLGPGMTNDPNQVMVLQQALVNAGYMSAADMQTGPGTYGPKTTAAVAMWQKVNGIDAAGNPGYFGPISMNALKTGVNSVGAPINGSIPRGESNTPYDDEIPGDIGLPPGAANTTVGMLPQEAFNALVPTLKPGTPEYEEAMDNLSTAYFDVMKQQLTAQTEQEQQVAHTSWVALKKEIEDTLNVTLSNDAIQAWDQIEGLRGQNSERNIAGSGLENESVDDYLRKIRANDAIARTSSQSKEEQGKMAYYTKFATADEIRELVRTNRALAESWGLVPSDEIRRSMSTSELKKKYPTLSDEQIESYRASMFDENGNYRSNLYQRQMTGNSLGINQGNPDTANAVYDYSRVDQNGNPLLVAMPFRPSDSGMLDIDAARSQWQVYNVSNDANREAYDATQSMAGFKTPLANAGSNTSNAYSAVPAYTGSITPVSNTSNTTNRTSTQSTPTAPTAPTAPRTTSPTTSTTPRITSNSLSGGQQVSLTQAQIDKLSPAMRKSLGY